MNETQIRCIEQIHQFLEGTLEVLFTPHGDDAQRYAHIAAVLSRFGYRHRPRADKGVLLRYLARTSGYSAPQVKRLVARWLNSGVLVKHYAAPVHGFPRRFTSEDALTLAAIDHAHGTLSGPATVHLLRRAWTQYHDSRCERLAGISVSHLYNLRGSKPYLQQRVHKSKTRPTINPIGLRRAPQPHGQPGFIRIDSVHQGDFDGVKGVYHINAVDCVTQWQIVASCEHISEAFLLPALDELMAQFPFPILGFHSDNGSEYINSKVSALLEKLHIEQTKSRPRRSNDNALVESKNGAIVRKHLGYSHIPQRFARAVNAFCRDFLNPYVNFHRPCLFAVDTIDSKGKIRKTYPHDHVQTPLEKLAKIINVDTMNKVLKENITLDMLQARAREISDLQAATQLNEARSKLFRLINPRPLKSAA